jgi:hypothetical protein
VPPDQQRAGPFRDAMTGEVPLTPAATTLGWELVRVVPEGSEIEVSFNAGQQVTKPMDAVNERVTGLKRAWWPVSGQNSGSQSAAGTAGVGGTAGARQCGPAGNCGPHHCSRRSSCLRVASRG